MPDVTFSPTERLTRLAVQIHRQRGGPTHVAFDPAALAEAAEILYGRRPVSVVDRSGWRLRFQFPGASEAVLSSSGTADKCTCRAGKPVLRASCTAVAHARPRFRYRTEPPRRLDAAAPGISGPRRPKTPELTTAETSASMRAVFSAAAVLPQQPRNALPGLFSDEEERPQRRSHRDTSYTSFHGGPVEKSGVRRYPSCVLGTGIASAPSAEWSSRSPTRPAQTILSCRSRPSEQLIERYTAEVSRQLDPVPKGRHHAAQGEGAAREAPAAPQVLNPPALN